MGFRRFWFAVASWSAVLPLFVTLTSCAHHRGFTAYEVKRSELPGTEELDRPLEMRVEPDWASVRETGKLSVAVRVARHGTRAARVERWARPESRSFHPVGDTIARLLIMPFYLASLGPLWVGHDHNGDGAVDWTEKARDLIAYLNPLEAHPALTTTEVGSLQMLSLGQERVPFSALDPVPGQRVSVRVLSERGETALLSAITDREGRATIDTAAALRSMLGTNVRIALEDDRASKAHQEMLSWFEVAEITRKRFGSGALAVLTGEQRTVVCRNYSADATNESIREAMTQLDCKPRLPAPIFDPLSPFIGVYRTHTVD